MSAWRMESPCKGCPFAKTPEGRRQWRALRPERRKEITSGLLRGGHFFCHKTASGDEDDDGNLPARTGKELVCAGSIDWQDEHGVSSQYVRICERLEAFGATRKSAKGGG